MTVKPILSGASIHHASLSDVDNTALNGWALQMQARMESLLDAHMTPASTSPCHLHEAMRYSVLGGGKRVRALLAYATGEFCGAQIEHIDMPAAAVEIIHAFSLVHDDMPCMDDDDLRRGKPSTHKQYGQAMALLVGDALQSLAFQFISHDTPIAVSFMQNKPNKAPQYPKNAAQKLHMLHILAIASGSRGMAGGQAIDLESTGLTLTLAELEHMHLQKTGALIRAAALLGAHCSENLADDKLKAVDHFAQSIGLAFQVIDDILDAQADTATLGKTAGKDAQNNKSTYVTILGLSAAKALAHELHTNAISALALFGHEADLLRQLANFITQRRF